MGFFKKLQFWKKRQKNSSKRDNAAAAAATTTTDSYTSTEETATWDAEAQVNIQTFDTEAQASVTTWDAEAQASVSTCDMDTQAGVTMWDTETQVLSDLIITRNASTQAGKRAETDDMNSTIRRLKKECRELSQLVQKQERQITRMKEKQEEIMTQQRSKICHLKKRYEEENVRLIIKIRDLRDELQCYKDAAKLNTKTVETHRRRNPSSRTAIESVCSKIKDQPLRRAEDPVQGPLNYAQVAAKAPANVERQKDAAKPNTGTVETHRRRNPSSRTAIEPACSRTKDKPPCHAEEPVQQPLSYAQAAAKAPTSVHCQKEQPPPASPPATTDRQDEEPARPKWWAYRHQMGPPPDKRDRPRPVCKKIKAKHWKYGNWAEMEMVGCEKTP